MLKPHIEFHNKIQQGAVEKPCTYAAEGINGAYVFTALPSARRRKVDVVTERIHVLRPKKPNALLNFNQRASNIRNYKLLTGWVLGRVVGW